MSNRVEQNQEGIEKMLLKVEAAKTVYVNAEYGSKEYFEAFVTWHNLSLKVPRGIWSEKTELFPFNMRGGEITLEDLRPDMIRAKNFLLTKGGKTDESYC